MKKTRLSEDNDDSVYENSQTEIYFTHDDVIQQEELRRREKVIDSLAAQQENKLDTEINALERGFNVKTLPEDRGRFRLSHGYLQVEKPPGEYGNISKSNGKFLGESTMRTHLGASLA